MNGLVYAEKRKAVAPIIATLLMVAIAVVGGILIFVFTQGFFSDADTSSQSVDKIAIVGYAMNDTTTGHENIDHTGAEVTWVGAINGGFKDGDLGAVYVENLGDAPVNIKTVEVAGSSYGYFGTGTSKSALATDFPGDGKFTVCTVAVCDAGTSFTGDAAVIDAGTTATVIFDYDSTGIDQKNGKSIKIVVETENGGIGQVNAKVGKQRGS